MNIRPIPIEQKRHCSVVAFFFLLHFALLQNFLQLAESTLTAR